jgi:hypothetical protein
MAPPRQADVGGDHCGHKTGAPKDAKYQISAISDPQLRFTRLVSIHLLPLGLSSDQAPIRYIRVKCQVSWPCNESNLQALGLK